MNNQTKFSKAPNFTIRHGDKLLASVTQNLRERIIANDTDALMQTGVLALRCNRIGFAWAFIKTAAKYKNALASECLSFLTDTTVPVSGRINACLAHLSLKDSL